MKRINEDVKKRPYHKYTLKFKKKVINEAKKSSNKRKKSLLLSWLRGKPFKKGNYKLEKVLIGDTIEGGTLFKGGH